MLAPVATPEAGMPAIRFNSFFGLLKTIYSTLFCRSSDSFRRLSLKTPMIAVE